MEIQQIGNSDGFYDTIPSQIGDDIVCLQSINNVVDQKNGNMTILNSMFRNTRMSWYKVIKSGFNVEEKTSVKDGDYVFVDVLARFTDTTPISFIDCKNILYKTDKNGKEICALKGKIILELIEPKEIVNSYGFVQLSNIDPYGIVISIGEGCKDRGFKIGDKLSIQKSDDMTMYVNSDKKYLDYLYTTPAIKYIFDNTKEE